MMRYPTWLITAILLALLAAGCSESGLPDTGGSPAGQNTVPASAVAEPQPPAKTAPPAQTAQTAPPAAGEAGSPGPNAAASVDCTTPALPTAAMMAGPYYTPGAPERTSLIEPGLEGTRLTLTGYVLDTHCQPIAGALLDFWQADAEGRYDNQGFRLRGRQTTDAEGRYTLETIVPGMYPGRTEHIHVKVQPPGGEALTTQLFFPDAAANSTDFIFDPTLVLPIAETGEGLSASFNFIVP